MRITRREFNRLSAMAGVMCLGLQGATDAVGSLVSIVKTADRSPGIRKALELLGEIRFEGKEQIKRAAELGLGARSGKDIRLLTDDNESRMLALKLETLLNEST